GRISERHATGQRRVRAIGYVVAGSMTVGGTVVNAGRDIVRLSMGRRRPQRKAKVREQPQKVCRGCCSRSLLERETVKAFSWAASGVFSSPIHSGGEAGTPKTDMSAYNSNGRIRVVS